MKRAIAFLLSVLMIVSCCAILVFANDVDIYNVIEKNDYDSLGSGAVTLDCKYSEDGKKIKIDGNVNYNVLVSYGKYTLGILRIKPNQSISDAINTKTPDIAAQMNLAAKFSFSIDIEKTVDRFSKYAVVILSPEGKIVLASEPTYIGVVSEYKNSDPNNFKGILADNMYEVSVSGDMGFGSAIIPVHYDRLINTSMNGYMYPHEDTNLFFDKTYIDELDAKIKTYSIIGARVYLQLLMPKSNDTDGYEMPDVYNEKIISLLYTQIRFLSSRYNGYVDGQIGGIIVGKQIDKIGYNSSDITSVDAYAEKYAFYLSVVANTARYENPDIDIIVPFSDLDCYGRTAETPTGDHLPTTLIEKISSVLDRDCRDGFDFNIMIESDGKFIETVASEDGGEKKYAISYEDQDNKLGVTELSRLDAFLSKTKKDYRSSPDKYIFLWNIPKDIQGNILECSYAYNYYLLAKNSSVSSFVISFSDNNFANIDGIKETVRVIDTKEGVAYCASLLSFFGVGSWNDLIANYNPEKYLIRVEYKPEEIDMTGGSKGSFSYFDFSTGDLSDWHGGAYNKSVKADYGDGGQRILRQLVGRASGSSHSDLFCIYEYGENFIYTPSLDLKMKITDGEISSGAIYEITVTMGNANNSVSRSMTVRSGEIFDMWLDVGAFAKNNKTDYIKISTRSITGETEEYSLWVYDISGHSSIYNNEKLDELISEERRNIRDQLHSNDNDNTDSVIYWIVFSIILAAVVIGGVLMIVLRRDDVKRSYRKK